ncbi:hypothetical protein CGCTS75_v014647 [Colletotrichum tropicale]|nr:hypothetical protein CGCTS75_v014647 [Colletotrichum tropicale]
MQMMPKTEGDNYSMGLRGLDAVILEPGVISGTGLLALKANHSTEIGGADVGAVKTQQSTDRSEVHNLRTSKRPATDTAHSYNLLQRIKGLRKRYFASPVRHCAEAAKPGKLTMSLCILGRGLVRFSESNSWHSGMDQSRREMIMPSTYDQIRQLR